MAERHMPRERLLLYRKGWRSGAGSKTKSDTLRGDADYCDGYKDGQNAYEIAMRLARERLQAPPPNILRGEVSL